MSKLIGITTSLEEGDNPRQFTLPRMYAKAVEHAGGIPVILPVLEDKVEFIEKMVEKVDGIILSGGVDVDPLLFGEEPHKNLGRVDPFRDFFEINLARLALKKDKPLLGICRGCQVLNIAAGGSVYQDIYSQLENNLLKHRQNAPRWHLTHSIKIYPGTKLEEIFGCEELFVNSFHHQSVRDVAPDFTVSAVAPDGIIEAIESKKHHYVLGVQWHPELLWEKHLHFTKLFAGLIEA